MSELNLVFVGSSLKNNVSHTPSIDDINRWTENNIYIYFVDPNYYYHDISIFDDSLEEKKKIQDLKNSGNVSLHYEHYYFSNLKFNLEEKVIYISYVKECKDPYDVMYLVNDYNVINRTYVVKPKLDEIDDIINEFEFGDKYKIYDIYSGKKMTDDLYKNKIYSLYNDAIDLIYYYFQGKFDTKDVPDVKIAHYCYNVETPILKGLIYYHGLHPTNDNAIHRPNMEICESADYRKYILLLLCKLVSNFAVNNNLLSEKDISRIKKHGWEKWQTYEIIGEKFEKK